jgi:hypothetical protein
MEQFGASMAQIQNLRDEVNVNQAVTSNFKKIDLMNGEFERLPGDQQDATLPQHIDSMRRAVDTDSAGMTVNQKLMFDRQTLWNLRAQMARAVSSANSSYHVFARDQLVGGVNNDIDHAIGNFENDAIVHLDLQHAMEKYAKIATMDHVPVEQMQYNTKQTMDRIAGRMIRSVINGPKQDTAWAERFLNTFGGQMTNAGRFQLKQIIDDKKNDLDAHRISRETAGEVEPLIGGSNTTGVVVPPATPPVEPLPPAAPTQAKPDIRSEISPAQDALNRGDYLAFATETYRPHAPQVQLAALPREMRELPARGGVEVTSAIDEAAQRYNLDPNTMRAIASIESSNNPGSNRARATQYKGLFQLGKDEWRRYGEGDIYNARDNATAAARLMADHQTWFRERYGRNPTDAELYMMHQQGRGFYSRGAMTNISGNRYPGMRGPQSRTSFQQGWANELARRKMLLAGPEMAGV